MMNSLDIHSLRGEELIKIILKKWANTHEAATLDFYNRKSH